MRSTQRRNKCERELAKSISPIFINISHTRDGQKMNGQRGSSSHNAAKADGGGNKNIAQISCGLSEV